MQIELFTKVSLHYYSYEQNTVGKGQEKDNEKKNQIMV